MAEAMITEEEILKDQFQNLVQQTIQAEDLSKKKSQNFLPDNKPIKKKKKIHDNKKKI